jgi:hypothetical protein
MNVTGLTRRVSLVMAAVVLTVLFLISGCGSDSPTSMVSQEKQYQQKVYIIGEIKEPENNVTDKIAAIKGPADAAKQVFVNRVPYDGVSSDAPVFIAADQIISQSDTVKRGLLATYQKSYPIILIRPNEAQINALLGIVDRVQNYKLPTNFPYAELFAVSTELTGNFSLSVYPPGSSDPSSTPGASNADDTSGLLARADALRNWVNKSGARTLSKALADSRANAVKAANEISSTNLTELVKAEHDEKLFTQEEKYGANTYSLIYTMYPFHQFNASDGKEYDWLYIEQEGILSAEPRYTKFGEVREGAGEAELRPFCGDNWWWGPTICLGEFSIYSSTVRFTAYSIGKYRVSNNITGITTGYGLQGGSSPSTTNEKTTTRSGVKFDLGGDFGLKANAGEKGAGGDVSTSVKGSVSISNEKSFDTYDCTVENVSANNAPAWLYQFSAVGQYGWYATNAKLNEPVKLARSTFQPIHKWIWRFSPDAREKIQNFETTLSVDNIITLSGYSIFWAPVTGPYTHTDTLPFTGNPALYFPPVIVAPSKNLTLDAKAQFKTMEVSVGRDWNATCNQDWCEVVPTTGKGDNKQFSLTVSQNTTGKERKATITFRTNDYKESPADNKYKQDTMYVTQSPF